MKHERYLQQRLHTLGALDEAISAMRAFSAHHFRLSREALPAARAYRNEVELALAAAGISQVLQSTAPQGILLIVSDLGLCGDYNLRLVESLAKMGGRQDNDVLYCVGKRPRGLLDRYRIFPKLAYHAPASIAGIPNLLLELAQDLLDDFLTHQIGSLSVVSAEFQGAGKFAPRVTQILPVLLSSSGPTYRETNYQTATYLTRIAVREYLYTALYELILDSLASEHGVRLVVAESAGKWLEDNTEAIHRQLLSIRRERITQEVLDIAVGSSMRQQTPNSLLNFSDRLRY